MNELLLNKQRDIIAAIATPLGDGGIGIIRLSGKGSLELLQRCFRPNHSISQWRSHHLYLGAIVDENEEWLDEVLVTYMAQGRSYTGEEVVEIHGHGGRLNILQLLRRFLELGARLADPGEFTRRAFLNGRLDLTKAEAIADLISASNEQALEVARSHLQGRLQNHLDTLADTSLTLAMRVESWIDFPEEFDPALDKSVQEILEDLDQLLLQVQKLLESYQMGHQLKEGWSLIILGSPNVGKSSLFNKLSGEDKAIVTSLAGTTRDLLETQIDMGGISLTLRDSAGLRFDLSQRSEKLTPAPSEEEEDLSHDEIEKIGIRRALDEASKAHLILAVFDASKAWTDSEAQIIEAYADKPTLFIYNKSDKPRKLHIPDKIFQQNRPLAEISVSCKTGEGLDELRRWLIQYMENRLSSHALIITNERQKNALTEALHHLQKAKNEGYSLGAEFMAEDLRAARRALAEVTGSISSEDILDAIFSNFCIGK